MLQGGGEALRQLFLLLDQRLFLLEQPGILDFKGLDRIVEEPRLFDLLFVSASGDAAADEKGGKEQGVPVDALHVDLLLVQRPPAGVGGDELTGADSAVIFAVAVASPLIAQRTKK